jgi:hypothetical protein
MHMNHDQSRTIPWVRRPRAPVMLKEASAVNLGSNELREPVGLAPGMLRKLLPWVVAPWVVIALVVLALC